jgi:hypothetical protein
MKGSLKTYTVGIGSRVILHPTSFTVPVQQYLHHTMAGLKTNSIGDDLATINDHFMFIILDGYAEWVAWSLHWVLSRRARHAQPHLSTATS